jgi:UDP-glucose 4-epimerase
MNKKKIIVFGATGNIGVYFIDYLNNNIDKNVYDIIATGRKKNYPYKINVNYISVDIMNKLDYSKLPVDNVFAVVDFAGILPAYCQNINPEDYINTNIIGTLNILEYCRKSNVDRIIYTQTWADINGYLKNKKPLLPNLPRKPIFTGDHAIYCISKCAAVDLIEHYHQQYGIKNFIFRLPNIYLYSPLKYYYVNGEQKLISYRYMIDRAIKGMPIECWGNPSLGKDIIYVKDLCQMIFKSLFVNIDGGIYNAGTGVKTSMKDQIEGFVKVFSPANKKSKIIYCPNKKGCDDFVMDIQNAKEELGYEPKYLYIDYLKDYKKEMEENRFFKEEK